MTQSHGRYTQLCSYCASVTMAIVLHVILFETNHGAGGKANIGSYVCQGGGTIHTKREIIIIIKVSFRYVSICDCRFCPVQGATLTVPRCTATLLLCNGLECLRCSSCARLYRVPPVLQSDVTCQMGPTNMRCLFCAVPLLRQVSKLQLGAGGC